MKFVAKLAVGCISVLAVSSIKLKIKDDDTTIVQNKFDSKWAKLFDNANGKPLECENSFKTINALDEPALSEAPGRKPIAKKNIWSNKGKGFEAYIFDYVDSTFRKQVTTLFDATWKQATSAQKLTTEDPYSLSALLFSFSQGKVGNIEKDQNGNSIGKESQGNQLSRYIPGFNEKDWNTYVSVPQLETIINSWGWEKPKKTVQELLDHYDFDGDGRLNPYELLLLSIKHNRRVLGQPSCNTNCYSSFLNDVVDPLFAYIDCDADGFIGAQELWEGLRHLKRGNNYYNIFNCVLKTNGLPKDIRTESVNDFILKNSKVKNGQINLEEFRAGLLTGFLNRQVDKKGINDKDVADKTLRWSPNGDKDIRCDDIIKIASYKGVNKLPIMDSGSK